jgi:hypothetical protein
MMCGVELAARLSLVDMSNRDRISVK